MVGCVVVGVFYLYTEIKKCKDYKKCYIQRSPISILALHLKVVLNVTFFNTTHSSVKQYKETKPEISLNDQSRMCSFDSFKTTLKELLLVY